MKRNLLIVGAGMATAYLLQELSRRPNDLDITVIGEESEACYNRVLLSNVLAGENSESDLEMLDTGPSGISKMVTGSRVVSIDSTTRTAHCANGNRYHFDMLVLATGAEVVRPPLDCSGITGVRVFRTLNDARELRALPADGGGAVVVGAGLLGLEAAHGLNGMGFVTHVVHRNPVIMNRQLDAEGSAQLQQSLSQRGINFHLSTQVVALEADAGGKLCAVQVDNGDRLDCKLLLFASGIVPSTALAETAGVVTDRGIVVDEYLLTSAPGIYAIGECSQFANTCFGLVAPIREQAAVLAARLAGEPHAPFRLQDYPTQLKISGIEIYRAGELDDDAEQLVLRSEGIYRRLVVRGNRLVGAVLVGDRRGGTWYSELISNGSDIDALRTRLVFGRDLGGALAAVA